jgi:hypothetical protein
VVEIEDDVDVGNKRKLKSVVWQDFKKIRVGDVWKAQCSLVCYHYIYTLNAELLDPTGDRHPAGDPRV